jgi:hypothetical protein
VVLDVFSLLLQSVKTAPLSAYTLADNSTQAARATPKGSLCLLCAACCNYGMGEIDALKLRSSMTLFDTIAPNDVFAKVLEVFFNGERCLKTMERV